MKPVVCSIELKEVFNDLDIKNCDFNTLHQLCECLGNAVDSVDPYTRNHSEQVAVLSYMIALALGFRPEHADIIHIAGHLHDIGKIGIPCSILQKPDKLTDEEWRWIKKHPEIGANILKPVKFFNTKGGVTDMVLYHHERWDGKGYPAGLKGREIPIGARIIAVADAFSAMFQDRPYRKARKFDEALDEIKKNAGRQFDPLVVEAFIAIKDNIKTWLGLMT